MSNAHIELLESVTPRRVEYAYGRAMQAQMDRNQGFADIGWRAAQARDDRLLKVLDKATEIVTKMGEEQYGRTRRDPGTAFSHTLEPTEVQLWREAYRMCDQGTPLRQFEWIYGAAAFLCGYVL